jgi:hypothetical protein
MEEWIGGREGNGRVKGMAQNCMIFYPQIGDHWSLQIAQIFSTCENYLATLPPCNFAPSRNEND